MTIEDEDEAGTVRGGDAEPEETEEPETPESSAPAPSTHLGAQTADVVKGVREGTAALGAQIAAGMRSDDPNDQTSADVERSFNAAAAVVGAVEQGAKAWDQAEDSARATDDTVAASKGIDAAGSTGALTAAGLDAIGLATEDQGVRDAATAVRGATIAGVAVAKQIATFVQAANAGDDDAEDASEEAEGASEEAAEEATPGTARRRATAADPEAAGGEASFGLSAMDEAPSGESRHVRYELHLPDSEVEWTVRELELSESLSTPYEAVLDVTTDDRDADSRELLGANVELLVDRRAGHNRRVTGVVRRVVESSDRGHHVSARLHVVPALWALGQGRDSVIFQDKTAKEILETVLRVELDTYGREVDVSGLEVDYPAREFCVQYGESHLDFCHRLMEEEGIGYYFDAEGEGWEKLVLFDHNRQLPEAERLDQNPVPFAVNAAVVDRAEPVTRLDPSSQLTATYETVRDYDWTQGETCVTQAAPGEDAQGRVREVYSHGLGRTVTRSDYNDNGRYGANDVDRQAAIRSELLLRDGAHFTGVSLVTGFCVGRTFELSGHPTPGVDGSYLLTRVTHHSSPPPGADERGAERYHNRFECIPLETVWRPERRTRKPAVYGIQTAVVTGGEAGEIFTDMYGRIQVEFHWDRGGESTATSCWIRVTQTWAGFDGMGYPGFVFIPRVGMEVVVTFVNGDPDRPLVTGAVYNGINLPPEALPEDASRSMIRTRSLGGTGYNELSFEDASGGEEVHLRAERNLRELVQNDHDTRVQHDQTNVVDHNQTETVGNDQEMTVEGNRTKTVEKDEANFIEQNRSLEVGQDDTQRVIGSRATTIETNETRDVFGTQATHVIGAAEHTLDAGWTVTVTGGIDQTVVSGGVRTATTGNSGHNVTADYMLHTGGSLSLISDSDQSYMATGAMSLVAQSIEMRSASSIAYYAPSGFTNMTPAREEHIAVEAYHAVGQWMEDHGSKMGSYLMALTLVSGLKMDIVNVKVDMADVKISNTGLEIGSKLLELKVFKTIGLTKAPLIVLG